MQLNESYRSCRLCPRACGVNREKNERGVCRSGAVPLVAHSMLHKWEEPCISGENGSGAVFFSGCPLGCVYCQNHKISLGGVGKPHSAEELASLFLSLQGEGAHNVNLVTATHFVPHVIASVNLARERGLSVPIVYNTSGYESVDTLKALEKTVDIYLTDYRYIKSETARKYSSAKDYPSVCDKSLAEMVRQTGAPLMDENGLLRRGVIVRLLLLPGRLIEAKMILRRLFLTYGDRIYISLMSQYTPMAECAAQYPELAHTVSPSEYRSLVDYARALGVTHAYTQEGSAASESFIPPFDA